MEHLDKLIQELNAEVDRPDIQITQDTDLDSLGLESLQTYEVIYNLNDAYPGIFKTETFTSKGLREKVSIENIKTVKDLYSALLIKE